MIYASACLVAPENFSVIISEGLYKVDLGAARAYLESWLENHGRGWYLRDEDSPFDCHLISEDVFDQLYFFNIDNDSALFKRVTHRE